MKTPPKSRRRRSAGREEAALRCVRALLRQQQARSVQGPEDLVGQVALLHHDGLVGTPQVPLLHVAVVSRRHQQEPAGE